MRASLLSLALVLAGAARADDPVAPGPGSTTRAPAGTHDARAKKKKKKPIAAKPRAESGADREDGWIVRQTDKGTVKVRRNQTFVFEGSDISGAANRPSQSVLGQRPNYESRTLIPERGSFRKEFYEAAGYAPGGRSE